MSAVPERRVSFQQAMNELGGVVFRRFPPLLRVWAAWLVLANSAAVAFIGHVEAQVALLVVAVAVVVQGLIYQRHGFVRLLGVSHALWVPMLIWFLTRLEHVPAADTAFRTWMLVLIVTNAISLVIDAMDVTRYWRGEREPYYVW